MADQVAANANPEATGAVDRVAQHLRSFWTPTMIAMLADAVASGDVTISPVAAEGLTAVRSA